MNHSARAPKRPTGLLPTRIVAKARLLAGLEALLQEALPETLRGSCHVANLRDGALIIRADNAALATQLRFLTPRIQADLNARAPVRIDAVKARVLPQRAERLPQAPSRRLSEQARQAIAQTAEAMAPGRLRTALQRLARHQGKS
ncbi:MAG: DciA family protein [Halothiobacillaceae bacterium]